MPWDVGRLTLHEINLLSTVISDRQKADYENQIYYLHLMGSLNSYAFNDPKKYPKLEKLLPKRKVDDRNEMKNEAARLGIRIPE